MCKYMYNAVTRMYYNIAELFLVNKNFTSFHSNLCIPLISCSYWSCRYNCQQQLRRIKEEEKQVKEEEAASLHRISHHDHHCHLQWYDIIVVQCGHSSCSLVYGGLGEEGFTRRPCPRSHRQHGVLEQWRGGSGVPWCTEWATRSVMWPSCDYMCICAFIAP